MEIIKLNWKIKLISALGTGLSIFIIIYLLDFYSGEQHSALLIILSGLFIGLLSEFTFPFFMNKFTPIGMSSIKPSLTEK